MRILHVVTSVDPALGGVAESIRSRGVALMELGHAVEVVSMDPPDAVYVFNYPLSLNALGPGYTKWQYHPNLNPWLRQNRGRFDAVVVDGLWQFHGFAVRQALRGSGIPYFVFPHGMLDPWFKHTYPLKHLKKWMFWPWAEYRVLRDAKAVLFTCAEERRLARQSFWLYRANEKLAPLGTSEPPANGTELAARFLEAHPKLQGKPYLLFLGRLHPKKGCDLLLTALAAASAAHPLQQLVMAGPAEPRYLAGLKAKADELGVASRVHWLGLVQGETKWGALFASEAFALISHQENFGIAAVEALACGRPVLLSDKVNIWREIVTDEAGLVETDTATGATTLIHRWLNQPKSNHDAIGKRARDSYLRRFNIRASANTFVEAMKE